VTLRTQAEAEADARADAGERALPAAYAIVLTCDDYGVPTHEYCRLGMLDTLYGPQLKAEIARKVSTIRVM
jgi:hypothetical protein